MSYPIRHVTPNVWLFSPYPGRGKAIRGIQVHASRSGVSDGDDGIRTERWMANPKNRGRDKDGNPQDWGGSCDEIIWEDGTRTIVNPDWRTNEPTYGAGYGDAGTWSAGWYYYQIEMAQGRITDNYTDAQIDSLAKRTLDLSAECGFKVQRIPYLKQRGEPPQGICTHEDSDNGRKLGKSDPGPLFPWSTYLLLAQAIPAEPIEEEQDMPQLFVSVRQKGGGPEALGWTPEEGFRAITSADLEVTEQVERQNPKALDRYDVEISPDGFAKAKKAVEL